MAKILLDEMFFNRDNTDNYISDLITFISNYFEDDIVFFHPFCNTGNLWMLKNEIAIIEKNVMKKGKVYICDSNLLKNYKTQNDTISDKYSSNFIKEIEYIRDIFDDVIVFNAPENHSIKEKRPCEHVYLINHITRETNSNIAHFITAELFMKNIINSTLDSPLPNVDLCKDYLNLLNEKCLREGKSTRIPIFIEIGTEVAKRNRYIYNSRVTNLNDNSGIIRNIFSSYEGNESIYASIDVENGAIEICNFRGKHQDEYTYENEPQHKQDKSGKHDIKV